MPQTSCGEPTAQEDAQRRDTIPATSVSRCTNIGLAVRVAQVTMEHASEESFEGDRATAIPLVDVIGKIIEKDRVESLVSIRREVHV